MPEEKQQQEEPKQEEQHTEEPKQEPKAMFTRDDLAKMVKEQLESKKSEWDKQMADAVAKAKEDGKQEASMSAEDLAKKHLKDEQDAVAKKNAELDKRFAELDRRDRLANARELLSKAKLPIEAAELLIGKDDAETKQNIENYQSLVNQGVKDAIHRNSAGKTPQNGAPAGTDKPSKPLAEMSYEEMQKFIESQQ